MQIWLHQLNIHTFTYLIAAKKSSLLMLELKYLSQSEDALEKCLLVGKPFRYCLRKAIQEVQDCLD